MLNIIIRVANGGWRTFVSVVFAILLLPFYSWAAEDQVLVIGDQSRSYFNEFKKSLESGLAPSGLTLIALDSENIDATSIVGYRCIVTVGHDATQRLAKMQVSIPILHALVTNSYASQLQKTSPSSTRSYLLVEQPVSRMLLLAITAMPNINRLGVLYGPSSINYRDEIRRQIAMTDISLVERTISSDSELGEAIGYFKKNSELLLTLPDAVVVNEGTAKTLILGSYMGNLPLLGYSQALVKAGALMAVYSTPEMMGEQSAELILNSFWRTPAIAGAKIYPGRYEVSVNYQVARALAITLPDEKELALRIKRAEKTR